MRLFTRMTARTSHRVGLLVLAASAAATAVAGGQVTTAEVMAGLNPAAMARAQVSEHYLKTHAWPESNTAAGFVAPADAPATITIGTAGVITVAYTAPAALAGHRVVLTPSVGEQRSVTWACHAEGIAADALPANCR